MNADTLGNEVLQTVAMIMRRCAMSATLCSRSGAMRAKFSLAKSQDGKICTTYAACNKQVTIFIDFFTEKQIFKIFL
jgi:hypothetical protein